MKPQPANRGLYALRYHLHGQIAFTSSAARQSPKTPGISKDLGNGLKAAGPFLDDECNMTGSLVVIEAANRDEALAIAQEDPYARAGLFESVEIRRGTGL